MMDTAEIKHEFPVRGDQCSVCLSVGRKLSPLGQYTELFLKLTEQLHYQISSSLDVVLCWECFAVLYRVSQFQRRVSKANELLLSGQNHINGSQSSLTTVVYKDSDPHTVYLDGHIQTDTKISNIEVMEDLGRDGDIVTNDYVENGTDDADVESIEKKNISNNSWARKRVLQNKKPKFRIINNIEDRKCFRKVAIDNAEMVVRVNERDRDIDTHKVLIGKFLCDICQRDFANKRLLIKHIKKHYIKYLCIICDFICYDKSERKSHTTKRHKNVFECIKCKLKFGIPSGW